MVFVDAREKFGFNAFISQAKRTDVEVWDLCRFSLAGLLRNVKNVTFSVRQHWKYNICV